MKTTHILISLLFVLALAGCSQSTSGESTADSLKDTAVSAWHGVGFAMNIANPVYYAKKGASYGYHKIKEMKDDE